MTKNYITTAIPYMNGDPHIGHAMDYCLADVCARYLRLSGHEVRLQAGTDEHGGKIYQKAVASNITPQEYVDERASVFQDFISRLNVEYTDFVRTTDEEHVRRVQEIWRQLSPYIYLSEYEGWYCTGCERFITEKEYTENHGVCPDHQKPYEKLKESNYYFRISDFKDRIRTAIDSGEMQILPDFRKKEILRLLDESPDVSISRPREQLSWGISVPGDDSQVMYVWMDALANYITVLGFPDQDISDWWPATAQFVGKDILRFHAIIWPAMLLGLKLPLPRTIVSHGMILADGQKMSKSIGNVVSPAEVLDLFGTPAFRYYFLRHVDTFADSDFTWVKYEKAYNNELANDLGNLVQRLAAMISKNGVELDLPAKYTFSKEYKKLMDKYEFSRAFDLTWSKIQKINQDIDLEKPWVLAKEGKRAKLTEVLNKLANDLLAANYELAPFLPDTSKKIAEIFVNPVRPPATPLFPKK
ncbi:methionine--tRNA ligase [Candidatus Saccharibacteria bacterium]|nr:methionine--tRNA ligase [Candidatus Saccharibacteria bacterium]